LSRKLLTELSKFLNLSLNKLLLKELSKFKDQPLLKESSMSQLLKLEKLKLSEKKLFQSKELLKKLSLLKCSLRKLLKKLCMFLNWSPLRKEMTFSSSKLKFKMLEKL
jgi:hypothetical protein